MNTIHDMGGMHGFGKVDRDDLEPIFHSEWERRIAGILACASFNDLSVFDENRRAAEQMPAVEYLATPYFGRWLFMIEAMVLEKGIATRQELYTGQLAAKTPRWTGNKIATLEVARAFRAGGSARAEVQSAQRFAIGDGVVVKEMNPIGHTRLPRYARGKRGRVVRAHGGFVFPDSRAHNQGDRPQHLYSVRFEARELWGTEAPGRDAVYLDCWEDYLE